MIGIATGTFYPQFGFSSSMDALRGELALSMLTCAHKRHALVVVDGGSDSAFLGALKDRGIPTVAQAAKGISRARQQGYDALFLNPVINAFVTLEPEKTSFIHHGCVTAAADPILKGEADIVIPARSEEGWESLPPFQRESEQSANAAYSGILRKIGWWKGPDLDLFFGPRLFGRSAYHFFTRWHEFQPDPLIDSQADMDPSGYSDALFFPLVYALASKMRIVQVEVPYVHPMVQTAVETGNEEMDQKRKRQREMILNELDELLRLIENKRDVRLRRVR